MDEPIDAQSSIAIDQADGERTWSPPAVRGHRSPVDRYAAGVLGGLGERFDVDPLLLRVIAVAGAVALRNEAPMLVPILYAFCWTVIPARGERSLLATITLRRSLQEIGGATMLAALATLVVATPSLWIAGVLAAAAWILLSDRPADAPSGAGSGTTAARLDDSLRTSLETDAISANVATPAATAARWGRSRRGVTEPLRALRLRARPVRRAKREPPLWPLTLVLLVTFTVVCVGIDNTRDPGLDPAVFVNGALVIVGGVLALSGWRGRAGWTLLLALPLIPLWIAFSAGDVGRFSGSGDRSVVLETPQSGPVVIEHGYGDLDVYVQPGAVSTDEPLQVDTLMTAGTTTIAVPDNARILVHARAGIGVVQVDGVGSPWNTDSATVIDHDRRRTYPPLQHECFTQTLSAREMRRAYREWTGQFDASPPAVDFTDPDSFQSPEVQEFLVAYFGQPPSPNVAADGVSWIVSADDIGRPCDPDQPPVSESGTITINATVGLGGIHIVRYP